MLPPEGLQSSREKRYKAAEEGGHSTHRNKQPVLGDPIGSPENCWEARCSGPWEGEWGTEPRYRDWHDGQTRWNPVTLSFWYKNYQILFSYTISQNQDSGSYVKGGCWREGVFYFAYGSQESPKVSLLFAMGTPAPEQTLLELCQ